MPSFLLINTSLRPTHVPPLQPLLPLVLVTTFIAQRRYPRPYTCPTPTVHHQPIIVKIHDISTNTPPKLIPMGTTATTRWRPFTLCLWLGSNISGLGCRGCLALLRYFFYTNRRNFYTRRRQIMDNVSRYATNQRHPSKTQQSNGVGVRFICGGDGQEAFIGGAKPDFYYFGA